MTPSYLARLLLLSSASYFLMQLALSALAAWIAPKAIRHAKAIDPRRGAQFLFALRILPAAASALLVAALCVPSYLRFEPRSGEEEAGVACVVAAMFGALLCAFGIAKAVTAVIGSGAYVRRLKTRKTNLDGETVWIVQHGSGLALAGAFNPKLLISERAYASLSQAEISAALRHERAHRSSRDNLKRLLIEFAPAMIPGLRSLDRAWVACAEWAADDEAANADEDRAQLAETLVRVARLQSCEAVPALVTPLVDASEDLSIRVNRLLTPPKAARGFSGKPIVISSALLIAAIAIHPAASRFVHAVLERLLD